MMSEGRKRKMEIVKRDDPAVVGERLVYPPELSPWDEEVFLRITSRVLDPVQVERLVTPTKVLPRQTEVPAIHWHPEFIPMDLIRRRIEAMYPCMEHALIIPTQHNELTSYGDYTGVEVDCHSPEFQRKVQLLMHFKTDRLQSPSADVFKSMLEHTFTYRSSQLYAFLDMITNPRFEDYLQLAAEETAANEEVVRFCRVHAAKLQLLLDEHQANLAPDMFKNKLIREFVDAQEPFFPDVLINRAQIFLRTVKLMVKENFSLTYFYHTQEFIEEARSLGAGIVVPHPEQFWPILLADYDVDGYEVWNPQSNEFTEFLVNVIHRQNKNLARGQRPLLIFMGDDTHMGEKIKDPVQADADKYYREIGLQPAWDDLSIRKSLIAGNASRRKTIEEYKARLDG